MAVRRDLPPVVVCRGCGSTHPSADGAAERHAAACARVPGFNATMLHHHMVRWFVKKFERAGCVVECEPRGFQRYHCPRCQVSLTVDAVIQHRRVCGAHLIRSGMDWVVEWPEGGPEYYDFTVMHTTASSYASDVGRSIRDRVHEKVVRYCGTPDAPGSVPRAAFHVVFARGLGGLATEDTRRVFLQIADASGGEQSCEDLLDEFAVAFMHAQGNVVKNALCRAGL